MVSYDQATASLPQDQYTVAMPDMQEAWMPQMGQRQVSYSFNPVSYEPQPQAAYEGMSPDILSQAIEAELREMNNG